jgi:hypothetical protein
MASDDVWRGGVDEIPVIDAVRICEISLVDSLPERLVSLLEKPHHDQESDQPVFMKVRRKQLDRSVEPRIRMSVDDFAGSRNSNSPESVSVAVLTFGGFEEPLKKFCVLRV